MFLALTDIFGKEVTNEFEKNDLKLYCRFFQNMESVKMKKSKNIKIEGKDVLKKLFSLEEDEDYFVRPSYVELADIIYKEHENSKAVLLTGSPGIGKTIFILYWLWFLISFKKDISV
jgi:putative protein kinase ArgK-like GTPase of G3E family